jgi:class 3 adenylate cyclase
MEWKRQRLPGMPDVTLEDGQQGTLAWSDVMVTWVFTDVAGSTLLWECDPDSMDRAIYLHNATMRRTMDEFAGHEIRNEGDSFAVAFHDALDAVKFCLEVGRMGSP